MVTALPRARLDPVRSVDVLVVGAGITGATVAYEAASRGLRVLLVDRADVGGATSAATGKLVHGGLRYLQHLEVGLVHESLRERRVLADVAPPYVYPCPTLLTDPGLVERLGLTVYDALAAPWRRPRDPDKALPRHRRLRGADARRRGLPGTDDVLRYFDAIMPDPERLTLAFVRSAVAHGAALATYTPVTALVTHGGRVVGARLVDLPTGAHRTVRARAVVNAAGPWGHDLLATTPATDGLAGPPPPVRSEGVYVLTRPLSAELTIFHGPFGHVGLTPWRGHTMIGPTETPYHGPVDDWRLTAAAIDDLLALVNRVAALDPPLTRADVRHAWGGLRPLAETTSDTYAASRAAEVVDHTDDGVPGLVTVAGGKYTTSRATARRTVDLLAARLGGGVARSVSATAWLDACAIPRLEPHLAAVAARHPDVDPRTVSWLVRHYGTDAEDVLALAAGDPTLAEPLDDDSEIGAQVLWAVRHEQAVHLVDVLLRRTGLGTLGRPPDAVVERAARIAAAELGWDQARRDAETSAAAAATTLPW